MKFLLRALVLTLGTLLAPGVPGQQEESDAAADAYRNGRYLDTYYIWKTLAADGDAASAYNLGVLHALGQGVTQDSDKAVDLFRQSADAGYAPAQFNLGMAYRSGQGVERDYKKAARWWLKAAEQGNVQATFNLASLYDKGLGVRKNQELARRLYENAANLGDARASAILASMDAVQSDVEMQIETTVPESARSEGWILRQPDQNYTVQLLASTDRSKVQFLLDEHPMQGGYAVFEVDIDGVIWQKVLFGSFQTGEQARAARNRMKGISSRGSPWLRQYIEVKNEIRGITEKISSTAAGTATTLEKQTGVVGFSLAFQKGQSAFNRQHYDEAMEAWLPLANNNVVEAQYGIAFMYESGWGVEKDFTQAFQWYERAASLGHAKSQYNLGILYMSGQGVDRDRETGRSWINKAAKLQDRRALDYQSSEAIEVK
jgi:hypothetical protein